jgi:hypothetical protein
MDELLGTTKSPDEIWADAYLIDKIRSLGFVVEKSESLKPKV